ncbi:shikimate dehydrogenase [Yoonia maritima]|uniref:shikimate dehydrogenase n=1 Tax=Yoonia maritima TaxID=1435347 RepID=UPI000D109004|nr:shikimate dehydrogenase [Yoonia maritima]
MTSQQSIAVDSGVHDDLVIGLVGRGIQSSRTPRMHMAEGAAQGQRIIYQLLDVDQFPGGDRPLKQIIDAAEICGFSGLNITFPYKIDVMPLLDSLSDNARAIGAVNTVVFKDGKRIGHNTDKVGFQEGFRQNMPGANLNHVLQIGAGGAGVAVAHALASLDVQRLTIADSDHGRAVALQSQIAAAHKGIIVDVADLKEMLDLAPDGIVNATPVGMAKLPGTSYPVSLLRPEMWVADIVYFPLETELLAAARAKGCRVLPGSGMAVYQAVRAFELFTGRQPDAARMKATFEAMTS